MVFNKIDLHSRHNASLKSKTLWTGLVQKTKQNKQTNKQNKQNKTQKQTKQQTNKQTKQKQRLEQWLSCPWYSNEAKQCFGYLCLFYILHSKENREIRLPKGNMQRFISIALDLLQNLINLIKLKFIWLLLRKAQLDFKGIRSFMRKKQNKTKYKQQTNKQDKQEIQKKIQITLVIPCLLT